MLAHAPTLNHARFIVYKVAGQRHLLFARRYSLFFSKCSMNANICMHDQRLRRMTLPME